jgi:hypothetical protein
MALASIEYDLLQPQDVFDFFLFYFFLPILLVLELACK